MVLIDCRSSSRIAVSKQSSVLMVLCRRRRSSPQRTAKQRERQPTWIWFERTASCFEKVRRIAHSRDTLLFFRDDWGLRHNFSHRQRALGGLGAAVMRFAEASHTGLLFVFE